MQSRGAGFFLVLIGLLLITYKAQWFPLSSFINWHFVLVLVGFFMIFAAFVKSNSQLALIGGIVTTITLTSWGIRYIEGWPNHWSFLVILLGFSFLLKFAINKNNSTGLIGAVLLMSGFFAWPGIKEVPGLSPIAHNLNTYWPVFIIGLGFIFMFKKNN